ncbi:nucleolin 2 [Arachis hypogaea]|uniref:nucleolin 2 n=1 Tax=Arachis hypogaea TaxID=3818 RepID=UPI000DED1D66|nr:nucleolin 2 [Arachis hypogaea]XP_025638577.1 nucleolin 2 [Arachis hypogaea]XP_025638578.1 nucleolin 2 [Arachis hypogaea]XP_025638579.1 nucleolin 2 [Arachis hypogaea]XP_025638580.1 nucleolin 2 [Arachis hypogaea]XP_025638581.1 nucleolin 2 [Arachis hypogaea]XP_025638582.1 nucleolin 2 [Arachis hypogaea]XP_025638583.1 nucleolin 2 [Arachis hypogaea]XP_025638584.1 nucleolin 2 [Arachis hypogaea]XP_025638585.1 nucleolin 2 [Arachis hypogaea]XP_025638586.1 nucleolin 2 [Arachis hypogaea]XP_025638
MTVMRKKKNLLKLLRKVLRMSRWLMLTQQRKFEEFFKDCGEVVDVPFSVDDTGRFKRFRHVEFAIPEAAQSALELNEHELLNHPVRLDLARERGSYILGGSFSNSFQKSDQR